MEHPVLKIIAIIISVLLIIVAGFGMYQYNKETSVERKALEGVVGPLNDQLSRLYLKRDALQLELEDLEERMSKADDRLCSAMILVSEIKAEMMTDIVPTMDQYGYTGILTISKEYKPGMEGCITWENVDELVEKGWELCIKECATEEIKRIRQECISRGQELPKVIYFPNGPCDEETEKYLLDAGFDTVIEYAGFVSSFEEGKLWHVPAQGGRNDMSQTTIENCIETKEPIVMVVGYKRKDELYSSVNFPSMLNFLNNNEKKNNIKVTSLQEAKGRYKQHLENVGNNAEDLKDDYIMIQQQIEGINKQIDAIRK